MGAISQLRASSTPTLGVIPISDGSGAPDESLNEWVSDGSGGGAVDAEDVFYSNGSSGLAANNVQDAIDELALSSGSGTAGDIVSPLVYPENVITAAGTTALTNSDLGKIHVLDGSNVITIDLPPSPPARSVIGFRMAQTLTTLARLDGNGNLIDGASDRLMWKGEMAILIWDGSNWAKIAGRAIPMLCQISRTSNQTINPTTVTKVLCDQTDQDNTGFMADLANNRMLIARPGDYQVMAYISTTSGAVFGSPNQVRINKGGAYYFNTSSNDSSPQLNHVAPFAVEGDAVELFTYSGGGYTLYGDAAQATRIRLVEIPSW